VLPFLFGPKDEERRRCRNRTRGEEAAVEAKKSKQDAAEARKQKNPTEPEHKPGDFDSDTFAGLHSFARTGGRFGARDFSGGESEEYARVLRWRGLGGCWKTIIPTTWTPVFDGEDLFNWLGDARPKRSDRRLGGNGREQPASAAWHGDGIYRSDDGARAEDMD